VEGISSTQINVRSEPSTSGNVLGIIPPNTTVQIVGKDPGESWWQILYEQGLGGKGWVTAQYVTTANANDVPTIGGNASDPNSGNVAIVQQQINVRSGPGTGFNSLGTLNAQDVVNLTGKDANGAWLQIAYAAGPDGKGWVNAAFVQARGVENLPIITEAGQIVGTGTPTGIPFTPTPTILPAWADNDSRNHPVANVTFELDGTHALIYNGDISSPEGDSEDWINFKTYSQTIFATISCIGSDSLQMELLENGVSTNMDIACGDLEKQIPVRPNTAYSIHMSTSPAVVTLQYIHYTIKLETSQ
jgi:N-acetylmuramoyl-L-alanine amidase